MSQSRPYTSKNNHDNIKREIFIGDKKIELNANGEYQGDTFKVSPRYGQPLFSGTVNQPVNVKSELSGLNFTGNIDEILEAMSKNLK